MIMCNKTFVNYVPLFTYKTFSSTYLYPCLVQRSGRKKGPHTLACLWSKQLRVKQCDIAQWRILVHVQWLWVLTPGKGNPAVSAHVFPSWEHLSTRACLEEPSMRHPSSLCTRVPFLGTSEPQSLLGGAFHEATQQPLHTCSLPGNIWAPELAWRSLPWNHRPFAFSLLLSLGSVVYAVHFWKPCSQYWDSLKLSRLFPEKPSSVLSTAQIELVWWTEKYLTCIFSLTLFNSPCI